MRQIFNLDGPVFTALSRLADLVILNLLFLLCCVPVVTIGASLTVEAMRDTDGNPKNEAILPCENVIIRCEASLSPGDMLRRRLS